MVIDLSSDAGNAHAEKPPAAFPVPLLTRLLGLARTHQVSVLLLTKKSPEAASLNSLISLRADAQWCAHDGRYDVRVRVLKDKRRTPGWAHMETCRGSVGMR